MSAIPITFEWNEKALEGDQDRCIHCGRKTSAKGKGTWVEVVEGGGAIQAVFGTGDTSDLGYMGAFPMGATCARNLGLPATAISQIEEEN